MRLISWLAAAWLLGTGWRGAKRLRQTARSSARQRGAA
jgi:hypothetical protein